MSISNCFCINTLHDLFKKKYLAPLSHPIRLKPKQTETRLLTFSRASRQLHLFISSFDWFIGLTTSFVIAQSYCLGFSFSHSIENHFIRLTHLSPKICFLKQIINNPKAYPKQQTRIGDHHKKWMVLQTSELFLISGILG